MCALAASAAIAACSNDDTTDSTTTTDAGGDHSLPFFDSSSGNDSAVADAANAADAADAADAELCLGATDAAGLDDATVQTGLSLVMQYGCANCHQKVPAAEAGILLNGGRPFLDASVFSKNLTPDPENGLGCWTNDQIVNAVLNAIDDDGKPLCVMPMFATKGMDGGAALAIATFLRTLKAAPSLIPESMCPVIPDAGGDADADAP
jgi:hypothetical protein